MRTLLPLFVRGRGTVVAAAIANATFAARQSTIWGEGSSGAGLRIPPHFASFDQNLFTQYHVRYGGRGVLIHWHVVRLATE